MSDIPHTGVEIRIGFDSDFEHGIREGDPSTNALLFVTVGGTPLTGDQDVGVSVFPITYFRRLVEQLGSLLADEEVVVPFQDTAGRLVLVPETNGTIRVWAGVGDEPYNEDIPRDGILASKDSFVSELFRSIHELVVEIEQTNPSLLDNPEINRLRSSVSKAETMWEA